MNAFHRCREPGCTEISGRSDDCEKHEPAESFATLADLTRGEEAYNGEGTRKPRCSATKKNGQPCTQYASRKVMAERGVRLCPAHAGLGLAASSEAARAAAQRAAEQRVERAEARSERLEAARKDVREVLAEAALALQDDIKAAFEVAIRTGDPEALRRADAAERLLNRVYGKPKETVAQVTTAVDEVEAALDGMTPEQLRAMLHVLPAEG